MSSQGQINGSESTLVSESDNRLRQKSTRATSTHIFFWGGILSNWYTGSPNFSGRRCFELLQRQLATLNIPSRYSQAFSTRLLCEHDYNCGEQWMMACKAWIFDDDHNELARRFDTMFMSDAEFDKLKQLIMARQTPTRPKSGALNESMFKLVKETHASTLAAVLRATNPRDQKAAGRRVANFDDTVWARMAPAVVTVGCVVRAEVDDALRGIYLASGSRTFVEGSPKDTIWGVGLMWNSKEIEDEANWLGENKLGVCHGSARDIVVGNGTTGQ